MRAHIIVDLGFGDAGKGLLTDFLVRETKAGLVVRYNGGAQAGHNVVTADGRHHTFSQFGSGTFNPNVRTYLSRHVVIHPTALLVEGDVLASKGVADAFERIRISDEALVITPFQQAANRIRELLRSAHRHGSCGVGVGETVEDDLAAPETSVRAGDLDQPAQLRRKLPIIRERKRKQILEACGDRIRDPQIAREYEVFEEAALADRWIAQVERVRALGLVTPDSRLGDWLGETNEVVFEGAQGVLLDADEGFHPYTTWSRCTTHNARELIEQFAPGASVVQIGVMRAHAVRHGPGPLPTEAEPARGLVSEHNQNNAWQGVVRYGWFDAMLMRYALRVTGGVDSLMVTHMDALSGQHAWTYCNGYRGLDPALASVTSPDGTAHELIVPRSLSLEERARVTDALAAVQPLLSACESNPEVVAATIERLLGHPVGMLSFGPSAGHVRLRGTNPIKG